MLGSQKGKKKAVYKYDNTSFTNAYLTKQSACIKTLSFYQKKVQFSFLYSQPVLMGSMCQVPCLILKSQN